MTAPITKAEWESQRREAMAVLPKEVLSQKVKALLPYQQRVVSLLESAATQVLFIEKSRRIGLTWGVAAYAALKAGRQKKARGDDVMYMAYNQEMTREFIDACAMWARAFNIAARDAEEFLFDDSDETGDRSIKAFRIAFASGFEIIALSSAARGLRGRQGVIIIDEAAFVDSLDEVLKAALAFLMWGGQVIVVSTHDGVDNVFNRYIQDILGERKPYEHLRIDIDDALRDGLYQRICLVKGTEWTVEDEAEWRQNLIDQYGDGADEELFCIPSQGSGAWLSGPLIEARMTADTAPVIRLELPANFLHRPELERAGLLSDTIERIEQALDALDLDLQYALGFDVGRVADLSVIPLLAIEQNMRRREALSIELRNVPFAEQRMIMEMVIGHLKGRLVGVAVDAVGIGLNIAEDLGRKFGFRENEDTPGLIWAIKLSQEWYRVNMPPLKTAFEDDALAIAKDNDHMGDLRLVKVIRGIPRVPDVRTNEEGKKGKKRHGDYAIGLALAHFASRQRWIEYDYRSVDRSAAARLDGAPDGYQEHPDDGEGRDWWKPPLGGGMRGIV